MIDDYWGVSARQFVADLLAITAPTIHLRINSPGGDVFSARAMATAIEAHPSKVVAHVDGLAASAASYVALAADQVFMAQGAFMMIHRAWGLTIGNAQDHLDQAALLEKIDGELVNDYVRKTGNTGDQVSAWLDAETWFTAEEAVASGFADAVTEPAKASARWNLDAFDKAPPELKTGAEPMTVADDVQIPDDAELSHADALRKFRTV